MTTLPLEAEVEHRNCKWCTQPFDLGKRQVETAKSPQPNTKAEYCSTSCYLKATRFD